MKLNDKGWHGIGWKSMRQNNIWDDGDMEEMERNRRDKESIKNVMSKYMMEQDTTEWCGIVWDGICMELYGKQ